MRRFGICVVLVATSTATAVFASDGRIEINQAKALAGGVTTGDGAGFPVSINVDGSYVLTSDLVIPAGAGAENVSGIVADAGNVVLDLNGFMIRGVTQCSAPLPVSCAPLGQSYGVLVLNQRNVTIKNGTIQGFGDACILISNGTGRMEDLLLTHCGVVGLEAAYAVVDHVEAILNGGVGLSVNSSVLRNSLATLNQGNGITASFSQVQGNSTSNNGGYALNAHSSVVQDNYAHAGSITALAMNLNACGWRGNVLKGCAPTCLGPGSGNTSLGPNDCDGAACPP